MVLAGDQYSGGKGEMVGVGGGRKRGATPSLYGQNPAKRPRLGEGSGGRPPSSSAVLRGALSKISSSSSSLVVVGGGGGEKKAKGGGGGSFGLSRSSASKGGLKNSGLDACYCCCCCCVTDLFSVLLFPCSPFSQRLLILFAKP